MSKEEAIEEIKNNIAEVKYEEHNGRQYTACYIDTLETVLGYVKELEEKIKLCEDTGTKLINKKTLTDNFINKQLIRDKIEEMKNEFNSSLPGCYIQLSKIDVLQELLESEE